MSEQLSPAGPRHLFIAYAREDQSHLRNLEKHLSNLKLQGVVATWTDQALCPGDAWEPELLEQLRRADLVLLLVTADFMASDYIQRVELKEALERHRRGEARIVPILVRPVDLAGSPLEKLQALPSGRKPVTRWGDPDEAWVSVVEGLRKLLERVTRPRVAPSPFVPDRWRTYLEKELKHLEPLLTLEQPRRFKLQEVYVPLSAEWLSPEERAELERAARSPDGKRGRKRGTGHAVAEVAPEDREDAGQKVLDDLVAVEKHRHFLIEGGPGSGKSTFLRHTALTTVLKSDDAVLPVLLELKDFGAWLAGRPAYEDRPGLLLDWAGEKLAEKGLDSLALGERQGYGRVLWLLDGLDEIFDEAVRLRAARMIGELTRDGPGKADRLLLTTRPHAVVDPAVRSGLGLEETTAKVRALDERQQREFLERWFQALYDPDEREEALEQAQALGVAVRRDPEVGKLTGTPLLLSTIAAVYFQGKRLPERRADLYEQAVKLLLKRRFGPEAGGSEKRMRRVRNALAHVALQMMNAGAIREIGGEELCRLLKQGWGSETVDPALERVEMESVAVELGSHTGLLEIAGSPPRFRFPHLGFQEFLAARALAQSRRPIDAIKERVDEGTWRETILLLAGYLGMSEVGWLAQDFIEGLRELASSGKGGALRPAGAGASGSGGGPSRSPAGGAAPGASCPCRQGPG